MTLSLALSIHHVGGRDGSGPFQQMPRFYQDYLLVYYEADTDCLEQIQALNRGRKVWVLPYCLAGTAAQRELLLTYDLFMTSLLPISVKMAEYYQFHMDPKHALDYRPAETGRVMERRLVQTFPLDQLPTHECPPPDFLTLDTQGSEYEILTGGQRTLKDHILGLSLEVELHPIYQEQKLFGDIDRLLREMGFLFVRFTNLFEMSSHREAVGLRGRGMQTHGEALFLRDLDSLPEKQTPFERSLCLYKLAFFALTYGLLEYSLACLRKRADEGLPALENPPEYMSFLDGLYTRALRVPALFPPTFDQVYEDVEIANARFQHKAVLGDEDFITSRLPELARELRQAVIKAGGQRLSVLPHGAYARLLHEEAQQSHEIPLCFFDNKPENHLEAPVPVGNAKELGPEDYVLIVSTSFEHSIRRQLLDQGVPLHHIVAVGKDLFARRQWFTADQATEIENYLSEGGFAELADLVARERKRQIAATQFCSKK